MPFSISAAIGFVALFGIAAMNGIMVVGCYNRLIDAGRTPESGLVETCTVQMRPVLMTCAAACVGLLPAAFSTAIGSQVQRPLAIVVVGGTLLAPLAVPDGAACGDRPVLAPHGAAGGASGRRGGGALMARARFAACLALAASLGGCMVGPDFKTPEPPPTDRYLPDEGGTLNLVSAGIPGGEAQRVVQDLDIPNQWWTVFQSQPLNGLIDRSLKANPDIKSAIAALRVSQQTTRAQRAALFPTVGVAGTAAQTQAPSVLSAPTADGNYVFGLFTALLNITYSLDVWGGTRRATESAEAQTEAQCFLLEAAYLTLASNVVVAAITEASLRAQVQATQRIVAAQRETLGILQGQAGLGAISGADVATQQAALAQAEATLPPLQKALALQRNLLATLTGSLPSKALAESFELNDLKLPADLPLSLPARLVEQRPDIRAAEANVHSAAAQVGVAVAAQLPQINLSAVVGSQALTLGHAVQSRRRCGQRDRQRRLHADAARRRRAAGQEAGGAVLARAGPGAIPVGGPHRLPQCRRHVARARARRAGAEGDRGGRAGRGDQPHHRAPPAGRRRHDLRHRADRRAHLPAGAAGAHPGAGQSPDGYGGAVPGAGRRLVESRRADQSGAAHGVQAAQAAAACQVSKV